MVEALAQAAASATEVQPAPYASRWRLAGLRENALGLGGSAAEELRRDARVVEP